MQTLELSWSGTHDGYIGEVDLEDGRRLEVMIAQDFDPVSPRDWDNLGTMECWHRSYVLGDEQLRSEPSFEEWITDKAFALDDGAQDLYDYWAYERDDEDRAVKAMDRLASKKMIWLPLDLYDHGSITMRVGSSLYPEFDRGTCGVIWVSLEDVKKEFGWKRMSRKRYSQIEKILRQEVETYAQYLEGSVYGFEYTITHKEHCDCCEHDWTEEDASDSCWGFYGDPSDYMLDEVNADLAQYGVKVEL